MPAYPFVQMPTFGEFINIAEREHGYTYRAMAIGVIRPDGMQMMSVMSRIDNGVPSDEIMPRISNDTRLQPHMLRDLCSRLQIPLSRFGLVLTEDGLASSTSNGDLS